MKRTRRFVLKEQEEKTMRTRRMNGKNKKKRQPLPNAGQEANIHRFSFLLLAIVTVFLFSGGIFFFSDFNPEILPRTNPSIEKIFPAIIVNAFLLWLLSILSSVLWTAYNRLKQTESEKLSAQIASLKSQINPHFLFNTLNNIYATAIDTSPKTADMVDKLSEMMRYTMKDTQKDFVLKEKAERDRIFQSFSKLILAPNPYKSSILFHHVYSLKLGDDYVLRSEEQFTDLVQFLNEFDYGQTP